MLHANVSRICVSYSWCVFPQLYVYLDVGLYVQNLLGRANYTSSILDKLNQIIECFTRIVEGVVKRDAAQSISHVKLLVAGVSLV